MSYLARLKAEISEKRPPCIPTKPTKAPSVSFVSSEGGRFSETDAVAARPLEVEVEQLRHDYQERAGIAEHDGRICRPDAEKLAFETALIGWLNNPAHAAPMPVEGHCAACAGPLGDDAVPVLRPGGGHTELHGRCVMAWLKRRRAEAAAALEAVGIPWPAGWTP